MKRATVGLLIAVGVAVPVPSAWGQSTNCVNYITTGPGQTTCLDPVDPSAARESDEVPLAPSVLPPGSYVSYLDSLRTCNAYQGSVRFPLFGEALLNLRIQGWQNNRCQTELSLFDPAENLELPYSKCLYSPSTIALLADEQGYAESAALDSGNGDFVFDSSSPRARALSDAVGQECQF